MSTTPLHEATQFRRNKQFKAALTIYGPLWEKDPGQFGEWDGWSYAFCLKEMSLFQEALEVCRKIYPRFKNSEFITGLYAQCIYYTQFNKNSLPPLTVQRKAVSAMVNLSPPHKEYSFTVIAIFQYCRRLMEEAPVPWKEIEEWLLRMDPDLLRRDSLKYQLPDGKYVEYASQQEEWYSIMVRAKAGLHQPRELLELVEEAQKRNIHWHYQNDIWMMRKKAFAYSELGQPEKAKQILNDVLIKKKDWFLYSDLGDVTVDTNKKLVAWCRAALERGKLEMKIKLFEKISRLIEQDADLKEIYKQHLLLVARIRLENGWNFSPDLESLLNTHQIDLSIVNSAIEVYNGLKPFWEKKTGVSKNKKSGKVKFIHKNGKSGMIEAADGKSYFFPLSEVASPQKLIVPGARVQFEFADGFDKKKNKPSLMAIRISLLS